MSRYLRYLRIAFSITCLTACVALVALWVRSNRARDVLIGPIYGIHSFSLTSVDGRIGFFRLWTGGRDLPYSVHSDPIDEFPPFAPESFTITKPTRINGLGVVLPHWFLVVLTGTFAVIPSLKWSRRFSVRTLLIVMTLIAALLGVIAVAPR